MADYVFGYGSLLERASRTGTNPEAFGAWPARVQGFERGWFHQSKKFVGSTCTFLGAVQAKDKTINGVIYPVANMQRTIEREVGYTPTRLDVTQITMLDGSGKWDVESSAVYIFLSDEESISKTGPTPEIPMVQSYVDICINGCLELNALYRTLKGFFTREFIETTSLWSKFWVNDRIYPRRPWGYAPKSTAIDEALEARGVLCLRQPPDSLKDEQVLVKAKRSDD